MDLQKIILLKQLLWVVGIPLIVIGLGWIIYLFKSSRKKMSGFNFKEKLKVIEDKHGLTLCIHSFLECGKHEWTIYRVIEREEERKMPILKPVLDDVNNLLLEYYNVKPGAIRRLKAFIARKKIRLQFPFIISPTGLTLEEIREKQEAWALHCQMAQGDS